MISRTVIVAVGISASGQREVLGIEVGDGEEEAFWSAFLKRLRERGLAGVQLVISDAHAGRKQAIARCFLDCGWQRCRVHHCFAEGVAYTRNLLVKVPRGSQGMVAAALRSLFVQQNESAVEQQWDQVITMLTEKFPAAAALMAEAREDVLAFRSFPAEHWHKIWSTNPLERMNKEIKRRTRVVGIFFIDAGSSACHSSCCWSSRRSGSWRAVASSLSSRWPCWTVAAIQARISNELRSRQPHDSDQIQIRSQTSGFSPLEGRRTQRQLHDKLEKSTQCHLDHEKLASTIVRRIR